MDKEAWKQHLAITTGLTRPTLGGDIEAWQAAYKQHIAEGCKDCKARQRNRKQALNRMVYHEAMQSIGLTRVYGAVSGKVYYE